MEPEDMITPDEEKKPAGETAPAEVNKTEDAAPGEDTEKENAEQGGYISTAFFEATSVIVTAIVAIAVIFTFCFRIIGVNGTSMQDTLEDGDWLIVTPYYTEPQYGDIVITTDDNAANEPLVKRVIGLPGDEIYVDEYDNVYVNGTKINDSSFIRTDGQNFRHGRSTYPVTVPEGKVMLMGDHRSVSWDSRYEEIGFIDMNDLLGKAQVRLSKDYNIYSNFPEEKFVEDDTVSYITAEITAE